MSHLNAQIVRLYDTVFDRAPDAEGLQFWNAAAHNGFGLRDLANFFIAAPEFASTYGEPTTRGFVESLYQNILDRPGEAEGIIFWTNALDSGRADRAQVVVGFSESAEHIQQMAAPAPEPAPGPVVVTPGNTLPFDYPSQIGGDEGPNSLIGTAGPDAIWGWGGDDVIRGGGGGNDILDGGYGRDTIRGGPGNDLIRGGLGNDWLNGGGGADVFSFQGRDHAWGDLIEGFEPGVDKLSFVNLELTFQGQTPFMGDGRAQLRFWHDTSPAAVGNNKYIGDTYVEMDVNGDGALDGSLFVQHVLLGSGDFLV